MSDTPLADELARISRDEFERYINVFRPTEQDTIASLDDSTVSESMGEAARASVSSKEMLTRMRGRYGTQVSQGVAAGEARQNSLSGALGQATAGNVAADADRDNRSQTLAGLMNVGQNIRQQALGGFSAASGMEGARVAQNNANTVAYKQQRAGEKSQMISAAASLGAMAIFAM